MKRSIHVLSILSIGLLISSCKDDAVAPVVNPPQVIKNTSGLLLTIGEIQGGKQDSLVTIFSRTGSRRTTPFAWNLIADPSTGTLDKEDDVWHLKSTGLGSDINRIERPGTKAWLMEWRLVVRNPQGLFPVLATSEEVTDSTTFHIHVRDNDHFTIEPTSLPGHYLNIVYDPTTSNHSAEFIQGKPQEFWFEPWE